MFSVLPSLSLTKGVIGMPQVGLDETSLPRKCAVGFGVMVYWSRLCSHPIREAAACFRLAVTRPKRETHHPEMPTAVNGFLARPGLNTLDLWGIFRGPKFRPNPTARDDASPMIAGRYKRTQVVTRDFTVECAFTPCPRPCAINRLGF